MFEAFGISDPGCVRKNNEDYYCIDEAMGAYFLADGMGGAQAGELASKIAVQTALEHVTKAGRREPLVLVEAFEEANRRVLATANSASQFSGMGTTLVGVLECGSNLAVSSVGDSRAYLYEDCRLIPITEDQTWANEVGKRLGLDEKQLKSHPMRHVLTMAIGVETPLRVKSYLIQPAPGAEFLLCSDGLHGILTPDILTDHMSRPGSLEERCQSLVEAARQAGGPDNITAVLLRKA
jgi:protein phosphatase